ncbi:MAG: hypothetical protein ABFC80_08210 [Coriobacteriales bacterium]|nr:hypothetical protein [Actinomycetes bacterium]
MKAHNTGMTRLVAVGIATAVAAAVAFGIGVPADNASAQVAPLSTFEAASPSAKFPVLSAANPQVATSLKQPTVVKLATARVRASVSTRAFSTSVSPRGDELSQAQAILRGLIAKYPILAGSTVSIGDAKGYQAICYYRSGRIVISSTHTASLSRILNHEVWHIIDWRDNGVIDWGENVPPH